VTDFIINDGDAVDAFLRALPTETKLERFEAVKDDGLPWRGTNETKRPYDWHNGVYDTVLALDDAGVPVAMADSAENDGLVRCRYGSVIAAPGYGGYAVKAMARNMREFPSDLWVAEVKNPERDGVMALAKHLFHYAFDVASRDIVETVLEAARRAGVCNKQSIGTPILVGRKFYKDNGLKPMSKADAALLYRWTLEHFDLSTPTGYGIEPQFSVALMFDAFNIPGADRARAARSLSMVEICREFPEIAARMHEPLMDVRGSIVTPAHMIEDGGEVMVKMIHECQRYDPNDSQFIARRRTERPAPGMNRKERRRQASKDRRRYVPHAAYQPTMIGEKSR